MCENFRGICNSVAHRNSHICAAIYFSHHLPSSSPLRTDVASTLVAWVQILTQLLFHRSLKRIYDMHILRPRFIRPLTSLCMLYVFFFFFFRRNTRKFTASANRYFSWMHLHFLIPSPFLFLLEGMSRFWIVNF